MRRLISVTLAAALWLLSLSYLGKLISSKDRSPPPIEMQLVELPPTLSAASAQIASPSQPSHPRVLTQPQPMTAPTHPRHARGGSTSLPLRPAVASHEIPPTARRDEQPAPEHLAESAGAAVARNNPLNEPHSHPASSGNAHAEASTQAAQLLSQPLPTLPDDLREQAYQAVALARFVIHADATFDVELIKPTSYPRLNAILLDALRKWRFTPATENGHPVQSQRQVRVHFDVQ
ncbi:energy transducer TonB [Trinickia diaoshuihuensis]|uniref:energy transducer TonB n=1 Tax=Trinickia diaoshuihuensis TaxID=2292265 RepID=UPI001F0873AC|nr:energy transducer TonB [Trinickia diaoshuihuensis]